MSENQLNTSNKAWQRCGVEERRKGWQLLLRRLPAAAKSLSSHLFTHAHKSQAGATFFRRTPTAEQERSGSVPSAAIRSWKSSRELFADFLWMDCCTPRASPGSGPTWFGQIPGQTSAGPLSSMTSPASLMTKSRCSSPSGVLLGAAKCKTSTGIVPCAHGRTCFDAAPARSGC